MLTKNTPLAVIGLDAQLLSQHFSHVDSYVGSNLDSVERMLYLGDSLNNSSADENSISGFSHDINALFNDALTRMAVANQINTADIELIVVTEQGIEHCDFTQVSSLAKALEQINSIENTHKLVAIIGINISLGQVKQSTAATISFDKEFSGYQSTQGLTALLLSSEDYADQNDCYVYSYITGIATGNTDKQTINALVKDSLTHAEISAQDIGLVEVSALAEPDFSASEIQGLIQSYSEKPLSTAVSCARSVVGESAGFSQVLGLVRTVMATQQRYIPAIKLWQQPHNEQLTAWQSSNFYFPTEARPWYPSKTGAAHHAAYSCLAANHDYCHVIVTENSLSTTAEKHPANDIRYNGYIASSALKLIIINGDDEDSLIAQFNVLEAHEAPLKDIAHHQYITSLQSRSTYTVAILCESKEELIKELQLAKAGIPTAFEKQNEWRTPKGSYFTPLPVNEGESENNVSFLYPGIGATYVGLGRDLFHLFPEIHQDVANLADDIGASLKDTLLNPRTIIRPDFAQLKQLDLNLRGNLADIAEAGVGFACVFTKVFENVFKVKADFATGYSMGEVSMYAALGAWQQPGLMSERLAKSDTFNHRLCGELLTLREHWGIDNSPDNSKQALIWETYTIKASLEDFMLASEGESRVYCTIINTPDSLLVAGYPEDCLRVIKKLGVRAMGLNMANAIHSAPANKEYSDMVELYTMAVNERLKTKMYSSSCYLPVPQLTKAIAHSVAKCLCERVDFPRLINTMYDKGARVFIEMGPGRSLCSWVDKILDFQEKTELEHNLISHPIAKKSRVAVPVNAKGTTDELTYFRAIAKLISHGVAVDLHRLFNGSIIVTKE